MALCPAHTVIIRSDEDRGGAATNWVGLSHSAISTEGRQVSARRGAAQDRVAIISRPLSIGLRAAGGASKHRIIAFLHRAAPVYKRA